VIKAVIFDFGGVVFKNVMKYIYAKTSEKFGMDVLTVRKESKPLLDEWERNRISSEEFWKLLALKLKISGAESLQNLWHKTFEENLTPNEKVLQIIEQLKERGLKVAVLSNVSEPFGEYHKSKNHYGMFFPVFLSYEIYMAKPDKEIYEHVVEKMKLKPEECIFVDDKDDNVIAAKEFGMHAILFESAEQLEKELEKVL